MGTKKRGKVLMNQKANTVADLAAVLLQQERGPSAEKIEQTERRIRAVEKLKRQKGENRVKKRPVPVSEMTGVEGVKIRWANLLDAEYAETWPPAIVHGILEKRRYTAAFPVLKEEVVSTTKKDPSIRPEKQDEAGIQRPKTILAKIKETVGFARQAGSSQQTSASQPPA